MGGVTPAGTTLVMVKAPSTSGDGGGGGGRVGETDRIVSFRGGDGEPRRRRLVLRLWLSALAVSS
eukprot:COSAG02_NODE_10308_length_1973_cov_2.010672_1_plen_65_part_00